MTAASAKTLLYNAAKETMIEYFQKTTLNGFGLLYYIRRRKYQRLLWFMFIFMGISFACFVVTYTIYLFLADPTVTSLDTTYYKIWDTPFPAISICSANKLSKRRVAKFLDDVIVKNKLNRDAAMKLRNNSQLLAGYFKPSVSDFETTQEFQNELDRYGFNVTTMLKQVSPNCTELLVECRWEHKMVDCALLFQLHATVNGYCCMFNYERNVKNESAKGALHYPNGIGQRMGLDVTLNASLADYFYTPRSFVGFMVQIFDTNVFPDASNGGVSELIVSPAQYVQVELKLFKQETTAEARNYPVSKRHCYFVDEYQKEYPLGYSQAECFTRCKVHSIQTLCGCVPFYEPIEFVDKDISASPCALMDALCLDRYRTTWNSYKPSEPDLPSYMKEEMHEAMSCDDCLPLCSYDRYEHRKHSTNYKYTYPNDKFSASGNYSRVNIYFPSQYATRYEKNVIFNWYQILSSIGGVIGICMGCSLISGVEVIYFLIFRLFENFYNLRKTAST